MDRPSSDRLPSRKQHQRVQDKIRTRALNVAFGQLRSCLPEIPKDTKLTKIRTLRTAITYIRQLMTVLEGENCSAFPGSSLKTPPSSNRMELRKSVCLQWHSCNSQLTTILLSFNRVRLTVLRFETVATTVFLKSTDLHGLIILIFVLQWIFCALLILSIFLRYISSTLPRDSYLTLIS